MFDIRSVYHAVKNGIKKVVSPGDTPAEMGLKFASSGAAYNKGNMVTLKFLKKGYPKAVPPSPVACETVGAQPKKAAGGGHE